MGLVVDQGGPSEEYEAIALPAAPGAGPDALSSAVFLRRSARPSRRAVLHLHDLTESFAPADLARWYNERGFHFYVTELEVPDSPDIARRRAAKSYQGCFATLDAACSHLREADGIDAIILSADEPAAAAAALWCDARRAASPVGALILSAGDLGTSLRGSLDISCPVLVISALAGHAAGDRRDRRRGRGRDAVRLGQHVTWLFLDADSRGARSEPDQALGVAGYGTAPAITPQRRRMFDEMGRWLGAYMYGKVRDQLL